EATRCIMAQSPCPILLVTSSVTGNFNLVCRAMGCGGLDAVNTPALGPDGTVRGGGGILARVAKLARAKQGGPWAARVPAPPPACAGVSPARLHPVLALGASTGGPDALARILKVLHPGFPAAVIIVQHIAAEFAPGLATWLQSHCALQVRL